MNCPKEWEDKIKIYKNYIPTNFGYDHGEEEVYSADDLFPCEAGVYITSGCTQLVFLNTDSDYVLKTPFNGQYEGDEFYPYEKNYSEETVKIYNYFKNLGFGEFFLPIEKVDDGFYIQEKGMTLYEKDNFRSNEYRVGSLPADVENTLLRHFEREWVARLFVTHLEEKIVGFIRSIGKSPYGNIFNDMHSDNYGFNKRGAAVLIDWAGYTDQLYD